MRRLTTKEFIRRAKKVHGDKYDYSKSIYTGYKELIIIVCPVHGEFSQSPSNHLSGHDCYYCSGYKSINKGVFFIGDEPDTIKIPLGNDYFAIIDTTEKDVVLNNAWYVKKTNITAYALTKIRFNGRIRGTSMHRLLLGLNPDDPRQGDHIDGNGLNNRLSNLRIATPIQNAQNKRPYCKGSSVYKGVYWHKRGNKWMAYINVNKNRINLGLYKKEKDAAKAYDLAAKKYFGEFAFLNFKDK